MGLIFNSPEECAGAEKAVEIIEKEFRYYNNPAELIAVIKDMIRTDKQALLDQLAQDFDTDDSYIKDLI